MDFRSASDLLAALRSREVSATELFDQATARIEAANGELNAVVVRDFERARIAAAAADTALARGDRRALLGLPMTVKESFNIAGLATTWGIPGNEGHRAGSDAVAVARLKAAGAVILGKTNVSTNLGDWQCFNPVYGLTRNPWDPARTPGGSSGGAAAALAAGLVSLELGSDLGGSLRVPAHCCGVFAHKPSFGLVPVRGHAPPGAPELSVAVDGDLGVAGPLARCSADLSLALDVLAGPDEAQATAYGLTLPKARHERLRDFRLLVLTEHPLLPLSNEVRTAIEHFGDALRGAGCVVATSSPLLPDLATAADTFTRLLMAFIGAGLPQTAYRSLQERFPATGDGDGDRDRMRMQALVASHRDWFAAHRTRTFLSHQFRELFRSWDLVLCPVLPTPAFPHDKSDMDQRRLDIDGRSVPYAAQAAWLSIASICGLPATVMPIGQGGVGLPIGIQVIGPYLEDRTPLGFAALAEREFGGFRAPPAYAGAGRFQALAVGSEK